MYQRGCIVVINAAIYSFLGCRDTNIIIKFTVKWDSFTTPKKLFYFNLGRPILAAEIERSLTWVLRCSNFCACPAQKLRSGSPLYLFRSWSLLFYGSIGKTKKDAVPVPHADLGILSCLLFLRRFLINRAKMRETVKQWIFLALHLILKNIGKNLIK